MKSKSKSKSSDDWRRFLAKSQEIINWNWVQWFGQRFSRPRFRTKFQTKIFSSRKLWFCNWGFQGRFKDVNKFTLAIILLHFIFISLNWVKLFYWKKNRATSVSHLFSLFSIDFHKFIGIFIKFLEIIYWKIAIKLKVVPTFPPRILLDFKWFWPNCNRDVKI